LLLELTRVQA